MNRYKKSTNDINKIISEIVERCVKYLDIDKYLTPIPISDEEPLFLFQYYTDKGISVETITMKYNFVDELNAIEAVIDDVESDGYDITSEMDNVIINILNKIKDTHNENSLDHYISISEKSLTTPGVFKWYDLGYELLDFITRIAFVDAAEIIGIDYNRIYIGYDGRELSDGILNFQIGNYDNYQENLGRFKIELDNHKDYYISEYYERLLSEFSIKLSELKGVVYA